VCHHISTGVYCISWHPQTPDLLPSRKSFFHRSPESIKNNNVFFTLTYNLIPKVASAAVLDVGYTHENDH